MSYLFWFLLALGLSAILTPLIKRLALSWRVLDNPSISPRKIHVAPMPLLGGLAVFGAFLITIIGYIFISKPDFNIVPLKFFLGILLGGGILMLGGFLDDKYNLPPKISWLFPAVASLIVVLAGIGVGIKYISNPFGSPLFIGHNFSLFTFNFSLSALLVWLWIMGMVYTTKFLDGLDGLTSGIALVGGLTLFALSLNERVDQPITATLAVIFAGSLFGFLIYNFHPASIFLGEGGSTFAGFMLGVLAVVLGAKIATALLVMGIPIMDVAWVIVRRIFYKSSPFEGDRRHLHYRLLDIGFNQKQAVLTLYGISAVFGFTAVFLQSLGKLIALVLLFCVMIFLGLATVIVYKRQHPHIPDLFDYAEKEGIDPNQKT
ncbi:MAG: MraY family glycosyltransferase [Patescibacteria group bacterium]